MPENVLIFKRHDGKIGVGFKIHFGGIDQYSISWPDNPPERIAEHSLETAGVEVSEHIEATIDQTDEKPEFELIKKKIAEKPDASNKEIIEALKVEGVEVVSSQVTAARKKSS